MIGFAPGGNAMKPYQAGQRIVRNQHSAPFKALTVDGLAYEGLSCRQLDDRRPDGSAHFKNGVRRRIPAP
jgi:hypothetical protein